MCVQQFRVLSFLNNILSKICFFLFSHNCFIPVHIVISFSMKCSLTPCPPNSTSHYATPCFLLLLFTTRMHILQHLVVYPKKEFHSLHTFTLSVFHLIPVCFTKESF